MLANAELSDGCPLGQLETLGYYLIVFTAGHDTTRNALSGAISAFLDHPDQFERLRQDPVFRNQPWMKLFAGQHL